jgi:hypothetical protein
MLKMNNGKSRYVFPSCSFPASMGELTIQKYFGQSIQNDLFFFKTDLKELQETCEDSVFSEILEDSLQCLDAIIFSKSKSAIYLTAVIGNKIIGICSYGTSIKYDSIYIYIIVVHPLISRLGGSLIEWLVRESVKQNYSGRIVLCPMFAAISFYKRFGFVTMKDQIYLQLNPETSDNWYLINGKYKLKDEVNFKK